MPTVLTHYYRDRPFRTLSALGLDDARALLGEMAGRGGLEYRLTRAEYLPLRREIEATMRAMFIAAGGSPVLFYPHYAILGAFSLYEDDPEYRSLQIPIDGIPPDVLSFTFTDSFFAFSDRNLRGVRIPPRPYHRRVYLADDMPHLIATHGLPGEAWRHDPARRFDVYIEAQIWDEAPLRPFMA